MIIFRSVQDLADALHNAETAHGNFEKRLGRRDENWPVWYAEYMKQEQTKNMSGSNGFQGQ